MASLKKRRRDLSRAKSPTFVFGTKKLRGIPEADTDDERAEKDRKVKEWLEKRGK